MIIELALSKDKPKIAKLDRHIPSPRLGECIYNGHVYKLPFCERHRRGYETADAFAFINNFVLKYSQEPAN